MKQNQNIRVSTAVFSSVGFSLIELLVAMAVGLVLIGGLYQVFVGSTGTYSVNERLSRVQENGRFALYLMRNEILGAGYLGCLQDVGELTSTLNDPTAFVLDFNQAIYGLEATGTNAWADDTAAVTPTATGTADLALTSPVNHSDMLVIRGIDPNVTIELTAEMPLSSADLKLSSGLSGILAAGGNDILLVTDCEGATVFQTTGYTTSNGNTVHNTGGLPAPTDPDYPGNATKDLGHTFAEGSQIFFPRTATYYVRNNDAGEPALYRKIGLNAVEELVEGVESMQLRYGVDTDGDRMADGYVKATGISDWSQVVSVRVGLLMRSAKEVLHGPLDTAQYDIDGDGVTDFDPADDRRIRLVMSMTVGVRNRLR